MNTLAEILYGDFRRLSHVWRYSAQQVLRRENVAEHSFWTALISMTIAFEITRPDLVGSVVARALLHDVEESTTGDLVRDMKYFDQETRDAIGRVEKVFAVRMFSKLGRSGDGMMDVWAHAKDDTLPGQIVALADLLCVLAYCREESLMGNTMLTRIEQECKALMIEKFEGNATLWPLAKEALHAGS